MKLSLKIEAVGEVENLGGIVNSVLSVDVAEESFKDILGKALYKIETQGYAFKTSEVYDSAVANFDALTLRRQHQRIFSSDIVKVSVKYA